MRGAGNHLPRPGRVWLCERGFRRGVIAKPQVKSRPLPETMQQLVQEQLGLRLSLSQGNRARGERLSQVEAPELSFGPGVTTAHQHPIVARRRLSGKRHGFAGTQEVDFYQARERLQEVSALPFIVLAPLLVKLVCRR